MVSQTKGVMVEIKKNKESKTLLSLEPPIAKCKFCTKSFFTKTFNRKLNFSS